MSFPLFSILYLIMVVVFSLLAWRVHRNYKETLNLFSKYFRNVAIFSGIASLVYALSGIFFASDSFALGVGNLIGEPFFLASFVYMVVAFFHMIFPKVSQKKVITIGFILVALSIISNIKFFSYPFVDERGILHYNTPIVPGLIYALFSAGALLSLVFAFAKEAVKEKYLRIRSSLISGSFFLFFLGGVMQVVFTKSLLYTFSFLIEALASILLFVGIIARVKRAEDESQKVPPKPSQLPEPPPFRPPKVPIKW